MNKLKLNSKIFNIKTGKYGQIIGLFTKKGYDKVLIKYDDNIEKLDKIELLREVK